MILYSSDHSTFLLLLFVLALFNDDDDAPAPPPPLLFNDDNSAFVAELLLFSFPKFVIDDVLLLFVGPAELCRLLILILSLMPPLLFVVFSLAATCCKYAVEGETLESITLLFKLLLFPLPPEVRSCSILSLIAAATLGPMSCDRFEHP